MTTAAGAGASTAEPYRCHLEWGRPGVAQAVARRDILVIVDTLRFSTAAVAAVAHGAVIYPCATGAEAAHIARQIAGESAQTVESAAPHAGRIAARGFSLSPGSYSGVKPGTRIVLPSPNGAACCRAGRDAPTLFVGALVNAQAVADALATLLTAPPAAVTVIACGERPTDPTQDGQLRVALEDYLGAGAILAALPVAQSPEARVCAGAFRAGRGELAALLWESVSGRELRAKGLGRDVRTAAQLDRYRAVPVLHGERLERWAVSGY